jgi:S-adenosylmethionine hydrolase
VLLHLVADYGAGDLAFAEVQQRLAALLPEVPVVVTPVPPLDSLSAGFVIGQLAGGDAEPERVVYHNVAPRQDDEEAREGNEGEELVEARLRSGVLVVGPRSRHVLSFVREEIGELHRVEVSASTSQFRSRDAFPPVVAALARGGRGPLAESLAVTALEPVPERRVVYVDGYGNLKTSWTSAPARAGTRVDVRVGDTLASAVVGDGTFAVPAGELSFAPGSSSWRAGGGAVTGFELLRRGGSAAALFDGARAGDRVEVVAAEE